MSHDSPPCRCGHSHAAHEHYRRGTDCALCAAGDCARYRADKRADTATSPPPVGAELDAATPAANDIAERRISVT